MKSIERIPNPIDPCGRFSKPVKISMISLNDTDNPRTGGEYVYRVIRDTILLNGYLLEEHSLPKMVSRIRGKTIRKLFTPVVYIWLIALSIWKHWVSGDIVFTSSSPGFPLFGDLVYHQPKSSIKVSKKRGLSVYERLAILVHENEVLSPLWLLAKKTHSVHISNSFFTKRLMKDLYGLDSDVIYPPVELCKFLDADLSRSREFSILVIRPRGITGITSLKEAIQGLTKKIRITVIGDADDSGEATMRELIEEGYNLRYLGYVSDKVKIKLFAENSHYLHLAKNETFGITVIESMAAGCIPVAPCVGAIPEYLPSQYLYSRLQDVPHILQDRALQDVQRKELLRKISMKYSVEAFQDRIIEAIKSLG